jgi:putative hydrolase of the HAD superfamily
MLKAILFDLDHTLIDWDHADPSEDFHLPRLAAILEYLRNEGHKLNGCTVEMLLDVFTTGLKTAWEDGRETHIAPNLLDVVQQALVSVGVPEDDVDIAAVMDVYDWQPRPGERAYPDALEVLPQLEAAGLTLGIITNASQPMIYRDRELRAFKLLDWFPQCRISAADVGYIKPHRAIFDHALEMLALEPHEALYVGDNLEADIRGAQGVGMRGVWRERVNEINAITAREVTPDGTITTLHDLLDLLDEWYPGWRNGSSERTA